MNETLHHSSWMHWPEISEGVDLNCWVWHHFSRKHILQLQWQNFVWFDISYQNVLGVILDLFFLCTLALYSTFNILAGGKIFSNGDACPSKPLKCSNCKSFIISASNERFLCLEILDPCTVRYNKHSSYCSPFKHHLRFLSSEYTWRPAATDD